MTNANQGGSGNGSNNGGGGGGRKNFNDNNDNRRNFDMMNQGKQRNSIKDNHSIQISSKR